MSSPPLSALIVEDDVPFALELSALLEKEGWRAEHEADGLAALGRLRVPPRPDLVILDLHLPSVSGWGIYGELQLNPAFPKLPILMVTASALIPTDVPLKNVLGILEKPTSRSAWVYFSAEVRRHLRSQAHQVASGSV